jgi:dienelactone hydrolase
MDKSIAAAPQLSITPAIAKIDEPLTIRLSGVEPGQPVSFRATTCDQAGQLLASSAVFVAGPEGCIDLGNCKPLLGSYDWVDAMGLIFTMKPADEPMKARLPIQFGLEPMVITFTAETGGKMIAAQSVERIWMAKGVERVEVRDQGLKGVFFIPSDARPQPAIILVSGSEGGLNENRAAMFASHGYAALALAYFAYEDLHEDLFQIPLEYFETAIHWLQQHPKVDGKRLAITGGSRGGELSLLLGVKFQEFKTVIAYVPSSVIWIGYGPEGNPDQPAWTFRGEPLPYITQKFEMEMELKNPDGSIPLTPTFLEAMEEKDSVQAAVIPVEKINGAVLLISGEDDQMWPSTLFSKMVMRRLDEHQFSHPYQHLNYPRTGHAIGAPYIPLVPSHGIHPVDGKDYAYGGTPEGQAFAVRDSWGKVLQFLDEHLGQSK